MRSILKIRLTYCQNNVFKAEVYERHIILNVQDILKIHSFKSVMQFLFQN